MDSKWNKEPYHDERTRVGSVTGVMQKGRYFLTSKVEKVLPK